MTTPAVQLKCTECEDSVCEGQCTDCGSWPCIGEAHDETCCANGLSALDIREMEEDEEG